MKIAYIVPKLVQAGNICVVKDLATVMCDHGHQCVIYYFDNDTPGYEFPCPTIKIRANESIPFNDFDIIHTHALRPDIYAFFKFPIRCNAHLVCTIHNYVFEDSFDYKGKIGGFVTALIWQLSRLRNERLLVLSNAHYGYYKKWFSQKKLRVAYNTRVLDKSKDIPDEDKTFFSELRVKFNTICASICQITDRKGLDQIVKSIPLVDKSVCYVVIGNGSKYVKLKELIDDMGLSDRIFLIGSRQEGFKYLPYIDVFCIPSHSEGFPLAMLEAASFGKAIVSSDLAVFKEFFSCEECIICKENDVQSFAYGINTAISQKESLGRNAQNKFNKLYSPEAFYRTHINIYKNLLEK